MENSRTPDALVYRRAAGAAAIGLVVQLVLLAATVLAALWSDGAAVYAAAWHMLGGLPIWIVLMLLYQQHDRERSQRLAAEKLAEGGGAMATIFEGLTDDLDAARRRLDRLYRYGLPLVSVVVAVYLLVAGGVLVWKQVRGAGSGEDVTAFADSCDPVGLLFVMAAIAFTAFVSARWISGCARQPSWELLRGGASYLMSSFVVAFVVFAGAAMVAVVGDQRVVKWLAWAIPAVMMLVGVEILLTSLLETYRPRIAGEVPRPAFDSRVLGLLTAPESLGKVVAETISYQFGVEVSRSWVYQLIGRSVGPLTLFGLSFLVALSTIAIVGPDERGLVMRHGALVSKPLAPGVHLKWPWPIETVEMHPVGRVHEIVVSSDLTGRSQRSPAILWTSDGDADAKLGQEDFITAPPRADRGENTGVSLVSADVIVQYRVGDLERFILGGAGESRLLQLVAEREASRYFGTHDIDDLLHSGRTQGGEELERVLQSGVDQLGLGIDIVTVAITSLHPPIGSVSRAFHKQIAAVQQRETTVQQARKDAAMQLTAVAGSTALGLKLDEAIQRLDAERTTTVGSGLTEIDTLLDTAKGRAAEVIHAARAYRWRRAVGERASSDRFAGELQAYMASPTYYRTRRFLEVLAAGLEGRRKFVIAGDAGDTPVFRMDFSDPAAAIDTLLTE